jgi:hypothetical protein
MMLVVTRYSSIVLGKSSRKEFSERSSEGGFEYNIMTLPLHPVGAPVIAGSRGR